MKDKRLAEYVRRAHRIVLTGLDGEDEHSDLRGLFKEFELEIDRQYTPADRFRAMLRKFKLLGRHK